MAMQSEPEKSIDIEPANDKAGISSNNLKEEDAVVKGWKGACPRGLEPLVSEENILIKQKAELVEAVVGIEGSNEYSIMNLDGHNIYSAQEETNLFTRNCCTRNCCGPCRPFEIKIKNNIDEEVILLRRPLRCDSCICCCCCLQTLEVTDAPSGLVLGHVNQLWTCLKPKFEVTDGEGNQIFIIQGPFCLTSCFGSDVDFQILTPNEEQLIGKISKQWSGLAKEAFTDADHFGISFTKDLDVKHKAVLLGAVFLIDFMFFEE